jgi:ribulose-5-phosphate 4-epimerase/fuculose-1-phosphate aldolase
VIPFSVSEVPLRPISHMAGFLVRQVPVLLMRGHGDVVVGKSIKTAVLHAVYTDVDA